MLHIYILKKQCVFGGHAEGKGTGKTLHTAGPWDRLPREWAPPFLENIKSQQDQTLTDLI